MTEVPPVSARVPEYRLHTLSCATLTEAEWPEGVPRGAFGPGVEAWVGLLSGSYRMSKRNVSALLDDAFGLKLSLGTVSHLEHHVSAVLAPAVEAARAFVRDQPSVNIDETGWREGHDKAWLWTVATDDVTVFAIRLVGAVTWPRNCWGKDTTAVVGSDRFTAYDYLPVANRQLCWAHLQRTFEAFSERRGEAARIGQILLEQVDALFTWWHRVRDGTVSRSRFEASLRRIRSRIQLQLVYGPEEGRPADGDDLHQSLGRGIGDVDVCQQTRCRAYQQRRRTGFASRCPLASHQLRHPIHRRQPLRRAHAHRAHQSATTRS